MTIENLLHNQLWGRYPVFGSGNDLVVLDPVSLESVFLSARELNALNAGQGLKARRVLERLGFTHEAADKTNRDALLTRLAKSHPPGSGIRLSGYRIVLTDKCNMQCDYCFVDTNIGGQDLTEDEIEEGLLFLFRSNQGREKVSIQWFGGEPTIRFDLMQFGDRLARRLAREFKVGGVQHTVVTNGMRITDSMCSHFREYRYGVGVSYDGPPAVNQRFRAMLNGNSADLRIEQNIGKLVASPELLVGINVTPTPFNYGNFPDLVDYFVSKLGVRFIYVNTPIPTAGKWVVPGRALAESLVEARTRALQLGGVIHSAADRVFQALDARRSTAYEHLQFGDSVVAALLPGGKLSICDINWKNLEFVFSLKDVESDNSIFSELSKEIAPHPECESCPAIAVCGGPSKNDEWLSTIGLPDPEFCAFYRRLLELALMDDTGLQ